MTLNNTEFDFVRRLVKESSAIDLNADQGYLIETRLDSFAKQNGFPSIKSLIGELATTPFGPTHQKVVETMTVNETYFFRDWHPFECLKDLVIPYYIDKRSKEKQLNIWCAASSSGQEPYSIAILLKEYFPCLATWLVRFIASDISNEVLARAEKGCYTQLEVGRGLPAMFLVKYFTKRGNTEWQIKDDIRKMVEFRQINLNDKWPPLPDIDIVFIRNVLIYFEPAIKRRILEKIRHIQSKDGSLFLGGTETTINLDGVYKRVFAGKSAYYQLVK